MYQTDDSDENIVRFSETVKNCFNGADIFRTAEDEFEAFVYKRGEAAFKKRMSDFGDILREDGIGASFEYEYSEE